jgi:hypothetical protein
VATTHLRTVYTVNGTYDNLYTRIIVDQVFLDVKAYILDNNFLRAGNTVTTRARIKSGVEALLQREKYMDTHCASARRFAGLQRVGHVLGGQPSGHVGYEGVVVRGINTVKVAANLSIPA